MRRFGPQIRTNGVLYRLWAPNVPHVRLISNGAYDMVEADGFHTYFLEGAGPGDLYLFELEDGLRIADPASRFQPCDVEGPSEVIAHSHEWRATSWKGLLWEEAVFLELHVGTFTKAGNFAGVLAQLEKLAETGVTAIELMPVADFPGRWNWGYDGALWFAPDNCYGRPQDLKALIDAAHELGLMVFLDVVYNHFGPAGNYLGRLAPQFFTSDQTPWGVAINYDDALVRSFAIENALYWLEDYRFDGLRLDAVHAIKASARGTLLRDLSLAVGALARSSGRHIHIVVENDDNEARLLAPGEDPPAGRCRAQWNDDYHHAWHVRLTGETGGYYKDHADAGARIARSLGEGFTYQGEGSAHRNGAVRGEQSRHLPPTAFVDFIQNHDQIGNRALGERLTVLADPRAVQAALDILLLSPSPPLLFMGEEWGARQPFPFFCDHRGDLAEAVRRGRRTEFADAYANPSIDVPDPLARTTRDLAVLDWSEREAPPFDERLKRIRALLRVRRTEIMPLLSQIGAGGASVALDKDVLDARWNANGTILRIVANLSDEARSGPRIAPGRRIWGEATDSGWLRPWRVVVSLEARE